VASANNLLKFKSVEKRVKTVNNLMK